MSGDTDQLPLDEHLDVLADISLSGDTDPRGAMTAEQMAEWIDSHPPLPRTPDTHVFMEPCGQAEGTDSCWFCGSPKAAHPKVVR